MNEIGEPRIVTIAELSEKIQSSKLGVSALGKVIFLIGAGCSVSAGVPSAIGIAELMVIEKAKHFGMRGKNKNANDAYKFLLANDRIEPCHDVTRNKIIDWYKVYDHMFERHYATPDEIRDLFRELFKKTKGAINWAHLCLGELAARGYVSTILTTNFDQLILSGLVRAGVLPVVCDGIESLNRIASAPKDVQLIELHGSRHTYMMRNAPHDVEALRLDRQMPGSVQKLFQEARTFVVVGYGGREEGVMDLLVDAAEIYRGKNLFWVQYSGDPKDLSQKGRKFLGTSKSGGLIIDQDADEFFLKLSKHLAIGVPSALSKPLLSFDTLIADLKKSRKNSSSSSRDIQAEIERASVISAHLTSSLEQFQKNHPDETARVRQSRLAGDSESAYERVKGLLND